MTVVKNKQRAEAASSSSSSMEKKAKPAKNASSEQELDPHVRKILKIREMVKLRDQARENGDFAKSDSIRNLLVEKYHIEILDQKGGPSGWKFKDGSSNKIPTGAKLPKNPNPAPKASSASDEGKAKQSKSESAKDKEGKADKKKAKQQEAPSSGNKTKVKQTELEQQRNKALVANIAGAQAEGRLVQGVLIEELKAGAGPVCKTGDRIKMHYVGKLKSNGKVFDSSVNKPFVFRLGRGEVIPGWDIGCQGMAVGSKRRLTIPPQKAYGRAGAPPQIPGNATLVFEVQLVGIN